MRRSSVTVSVGSLRDCLQRRCVGGAAVIRPTGHLREDPKPHGWHNPSIGQPRLPWRRPQRACGNDLDADDYGHVHPALLREQHAMVAGYVKDTRERKERVHPNGPGGPGAFFHGNAREGKKHTKGDPNSPFQDEPVRYAKIK